jgi:hypothetical protein
VTHRFRFGFTAPAIEEKIDWIRDAAGSRFDEIELSAQLLECAVTDRPEQHLSDLAERIAGVVERMGGGRIDLGQDDLRRSPIVAVGSDRRRLRAARRDPRALRDQLLHRADRRPSRGARSGDRAPGGNVTGPALALPQ